MASCREAGSSKGEGSTRWYASISIPYSDIKVTDCTDADVDRELRFIPSTYRAALKQPLKSVITLKHNGGQNIQWGLHIQGAYLRERGFGGFSAIKVEDGKKKSGISNYAWTRTQSVVRSTHPSSHTVDGVFALPEIKWDTLERNGLKDVERLRVLAEWMSWCVVEVGNRIKSMGEEKAVKVNVTSLLDQVFADEAKRNDTRRSNRGRKGDVEGILRFRLYWKQGPLLMLQQR